ncbi:hypothetical protein P8452_75809 [Trifolium repens]|nr:hypothetical protein P8452_75809 [Trifolium repens]
MVSAFVIKVKYGDDLKRFNVNVDENNRMDLNMVGLKAKIRSIFNFSAGANFILKYVDEEGDLVNLVDDADLHDMMSQKLEFLRIKVHMIDNFGGETTWIEVILVFCVIVTWWIWFWVMCLNMLNQSTKG